jgi:hypothetical protein
LGNLVFAISVNKKNTAMNRFSKALLAGISAFLYTMNCGAQPPARLTEAQWREDLRFLQKTVHEKYSNLFYNITASRWDSAVNALDRKLGGLTESETKVEFVKLVALFHVGHTMVRQRTGIGQNTVPWVHPIPLKFYLFSDGLYIKSAASQYKDAVGGKVVSIGDTPAREVLEKIRPTLSFENEQGFKNMLQYFLNIPEYLQASGIIKETTVVPVTYEKNGKQNTINVQPENAMAATPHGNFFDESNWVDAYSGKSMPLWMKGPGRLRYFEYLPASKTVYVKHSGVQDETDETIAAFFSKVFRFVNENEVEKFILDIRLNGGGNNYLNKPVITGIIGSPKINQKGKLFIITGRATFSAAQNLTNELEKYTEAIFVGEPTSENVNFYGDTRTEILPNSQLNVNLSWLWWQNLDPRDKRPWTAPQLAAELSFADYVGGNDPAMDLVNNYKETEAIETKLKNLVAEGKEAEALTEARAYLNDPVHRYFRNELETKINGSGYSFMNQNKFKEASKLFALNVALYPNSANVYDSYAESLWKLGNIQEAVRNYRLAIEKDPNGATGENARNMIRQIEEKKGF